MSQLFNQIDAFQKFTDWQSTQRQSTQRQAAQQQAAQRQSTQRQAEQLLTQFRPLIKHKLSGLWDQDECILQMPLLQALYRMPLQSFLEKEEPDACILSYLKKTTERAAAQAKRAEERQIPKNAVYLDEIEWDPPEQDQTTLKTELRDALSHLPEKQRDVIRYAYFYGYSVSEIGEAMQISRQAVNQIKKRALGELKKILK